MANPFQRATKANAKLRLALIGPSGSGKTYTALTLATRLAQSASGRVAVIDTERGSASLYADLFTFDSLDLDRFGPDTYVEAIRAAGAAGYDVLVIDSLTHAWSGKGGALELVDEEKARSRAGNSFTAWREVTPLHNRLVDTILEAPLHVIATMRSKTEYVLQPDDRGRMVPTKIGMAPIQRDGMEYEFTVVGDMDQKNKLVITKTRIPPLTNRVIEKPDAALADELQAWLNTGVDAAPPKPAHATVNANGQTNGAHEAPSQPQPSPAEAQFRAVSRGKTPRQLCDALGITPENGSSASDGITGASRAHGWDLLRRCIEDGITLAVALRSEPSKQDEPDLTDPDELPFDADDEPQQGELLNGGHADPVDGPRPKARAR